MSFLKNSRKIYLKFLFYLRFLVVLDVFNNFERSMNTLSKLLAIMLMGMAFPFLFNIISLYNNFFIIKSPYILISL